MSPLAARKAEKLGFKNVKVFHAGLPAWKSANHIVVSNAAAIENYDKNDLSYILIDLRPKSQVEQGHMPKAIALPDAGIEALKDQFPKFKNAAVVLYNENGDTAQAQDAYNKITDWGYKNVTILTGGFQAWEKAGKQVVKGPAESKIAYVRKLAPGEVELTVFKDVLANPKDSVILDVRAVSEATAGSLPNALNIPLDDLEKRLADIPKKQADIYSLWNRGPCRDGIQRLEKGRG